MGNPHAVFFVERLDALDVAALGARLERHPLFPERANIGFAQLVEPDVLRLRVFERGAGLTLGLRQRRLRRHGGGAPARRLWAIVRGSSWTAASWSASGRARGR